MLNETRIPKQKRSIEKYEKIVNAGWELISKNGYYNTNTAEIAQKAGVSTGIIYQYFKDKHNILIEGIKRYGDDIFFPVLKNINNINSNNLEFIFEEMINEYINDHKISKNTHEEIMSMIHNDPDIAKYYYDREMNLTKSLYDILKNNNFKEENLLEKVHLIIGMIDNLCHETCYHRHKELNYKAMAEIVIKNINNLLRTNNN